MMHRPIRLSRVAAVGALVALGSCSSDHYVLNPAPNDQLFRSYVAIGNSITAGYQSGGINDSTQRQSYARLLATAMGTQYHYASLCFPGSPPPIANALSGTRLAAGANACIGRMSGSVTDVLNNVAVPGATSYDPVATSTGASNALTTLILGGRTQVQAAIQAHPTFVSIWIGNNDVLGAGGSGILTPNPALGQAGILSTQAQFQANYDAMLKQLTDSLPGLSGVLIGVVQVGGIPLLSTGDTISKASTANRAGMNAIAGTTVTVSPNCVGSTALVNVPSLLQAVRAGTHPPLISCVANSPQAPVGDIFVLDDAEQATLGAVINGYNAYIASKAAALGFAYVDPNPILAAQRATNAIPRLPNFTSTTAAFGSLISLDGVHPAAAAHVLIANTIISAINAKYHTSLAPVQ